MGENNVPISGDLIQEKALKFAAEKGIKDFCASDDEKSEPDAPSISTSEALNQIRKLQF